MPETQYGVGQNWALNAGRLAQATSATEYSSTNYYALLKAENLRVVPNGEWDESADQAGDISQITVHGDYLEMEVEAVPQGTTLALAAGCAKVPPRGTQFHAYNFGKAHIPIGPFAVSGINSVPGPTGGLTTAVTPDVQPWRLFSGTINATNTGKWTLSLTLRRYPTMPYGPVIA